MKVIKKHIDAKCEIVAANAKRFNDECDTFDLVPDDIDQKCNAFSVGYCSSKYKSR